jgi:hypothetical protein
VQVVLPQVQE